MTGHFEPVAPLVQAAAIEPASCARVALALADAQDTNEGKFAASMACIATWTELSKGQARKHVHLLIKIGVLNVLANANGGNPLVRPVYQLNPQRLRVLAQRPGKTPDLFHSVPVPRMRFFAADAEDAEYARQRMVMELHGRAGSRYIQFFHESPQGDIAYGRAPLQLLMLPPLAEGAWAGWLNPQPGAPVWARSFYTFPETMEKLQHWAQEMALGRSESRAGHAHRQAIDQQGNPYGQ